MPLIEWNNYYSVNVEEIDDQHKMLVEMINDLDRAFREDKSYEATVEIIIKLKEYATNHFATEEKYFDLFNYADTKLHKNEHNDFTLKVKKFQKDFVDGSATLSADVMNFIYDWLRLHILESDKKYTECFNSNGLK